VRCSHLQTSYRLFPNGVADVLEDLGLPPSALFSYLRFIFFLIFPPIIQPHFFSSALWVHMFATRIQMNGYKLKEIR